MDKISRIIPSSPRTRAAEVSESQPARPGAPGMGRIQGASPVPPASEIQDRISFDAAERATKDLPPLYKASSKDTARAKVVDEMAKRFFDGKGVKDVARGGSELSKSEELADQADDARETFARA